jgi:hypothetical protein
MAIPGHLFGQRTIHRAASVALLCRAYGALQPYGSTVIDSDSTLSPIGSPSRS